MMRGLLIGSAVVGMLAVGGVVSAQPKTPAAPGVTPKAPGVAPKVEPKPAVPAVVGATEVAKFSAATGFVDDPIATDDTRLAYVLADASTKAELHVVTLGSAPASA